MASESSAEFRQLFGVALLAYVEYIRTGAVMAPEPDALAAYEAAKDELDAYVAKLEAERDQMVQEIATAHADRLVDRERLLAEIERLRGLLPTAEEQEALRAAVAGAAAVQWERDLRDYLRRLRGDDGE